MGGVIYKISNTINKKIYIGSSILFKKRKSEHKFHLKRNTHHSMILQRHVNKYGLKTLIFEIIEFVENKNLLIEREQYYIDTLKPYFNVLKFAGRTLGYKHSKETILKISKSKIGNVASNETKLKMSMCRKGNKHPNFGKKMSEEQKIKISITKTGRTLTEEHKRKIGAKIKGRVHSEETKAKISNSNIGSHRFSEEMKKKMSATIAIKKLMLLKYI